jgi:hypothetical protein
MGAEPGRGAATAGSGSGGSAGRGGSTDPGSTDPGDTPPLKPLEVTTTPTINVTLSAEAVPYATH